MAKQETKKPALLRYEKDKAILDQNTQSADAKYNEILGIINDLPFTESMSYTVREELPARTLARLQSEAGYRIDRLPGEVGHIIKWGHLGA